MLSVISVYGSCILRCAVAVGLSMWTEKAFGLSSPVACLLMSSVAFEVLLAR